MPDDKARVQQYKELVLEYENLDEQIDVLLERNNGGTENMSAEDLQVYRQLAERRDDIHNQIRALENSLLDDDDASSP